MTIRITTPRGRRIRHVGPAQRKVDPVNLVLGLGATSVRRVRRPQGGPTTRALLQLRLAKDALDDAVHLALAEQDRLALDQLARRLHIDVERTVAAMIHLQLQGEIADLQKSIAELLREDAMKDNGASTVAREDR